MVTLWDGRPRSHPPQLRNISVWIAGGQIHCRARFRVDRTLCARVIFGKALLRANCSGAYFVAQERHRNETGCSNSASNWAPFHHRPMTTTSRSVTSPCKPGIHRRYCDRRRDGELPVEGLVVHPPVYSSVGQPSNRGERRTTGLNIRTDVWMTIDGQQDRVDGAVPRSSSKRRTRTPRSAARNRCWRRTLPVISFQMKY